MRNLLAAAVFVPVCLDAPLLRQDYGAAQGSPNVEDMIKLFGGRLQKGPGKLRSEAVNADNSRVWTNNRTKLERNGKQENSQSGKIPQSMESRSTKTSALTPKLTLAKTPTGIRGSVVRTPLGSPGPAVKPLTRTPLGSPGSAVKPLTRTPLGSPGSAVKPLTRTPLGSPGSAVKPLTRTPLGSPGSAVKPLTRTPSRSSIGETPGKSFARPENETRKITRTVTKGTTRRQSPAETPSSTPATPAGAPFTSRIRSPSNSIRNSRLIVPQPNVSTHEDGTKVNLYRRRDLSSCYTSITDLDVLSRGEVFSEVRGKLILPGAVLTVYQRIYHNVKDLNAAWSDVCKATSHAGSYGYWYKSDGHNNVALLFCEPETKSMEDLVIQPIANSGQGDFDEENQVFMDSWKVAGLPVEITARFDVLYNLANRILLVRDANGVPTVVYDMNSVCADKQAEFQKISTPLVRNFYRCDAFAHALQNIKFSSP